ncbi:5-(carboxyamino)imidazole ribonucleotide synthase [Salinirubrum litoreum]|uniref:N5-carboxyaminoimidazole ribonucleotide synthase n=1 Tax=Salinirubrum litoreum TaxID=1126234 RepID=A0ABD5R6I7_9EURY
MTPTAPGPTLGVVGGGQLGRMLGEAAAPLGVDLVVSDPTPDCPAAPVARAQIEGDFDDPETLRRLADRADVLTFEIELADPEVLDAVSDEFGVPVHPAPDTLRTIQDKLVQKRALADAGVPVPEFVAVDDEADLREAVERFGGVMLKAREGGYDGRGNLPVQSPDEAGEALAELSGPAMAEQFLDFERELSVIGVQGDGETALFPVTETIHREEILRETVAPARADDEVLARAREVAQSVLDLLDGRGVFGIELFETSEGEVLVNEIAPRPHNSGHWTIEGCQTSQFEQHVRAVLGWPLGSTKLRAPTVSANVLGDVPDSRRAQVTGLDSLLAEPGVGFHWYGKREARPLRKLGHLTAVADAGPEDSTDAPTREDLLATARDLRDGLVFE